MVVVEFGSGLVGIVVVVVRLEGHIAFVGLVVVVVVVSAVLEYSVALECRCMLVLTYGQTSIWLDGITNRVGK